MASAIGRLTDPQGAGAPRSSFGLRDADWTRAALNPEISDQATPPVRPRHGGIGQDGLRDFRTSHAKAPEGESGRSSHGGTSSSGNVGLQRLPCGAEELLEQEGGYPGVTAKVGDVGPEGREGVAAAIDALPHDVVGDAPLVPPDRGSKVEAAFRAEEPARAGRPPGPVIGFAYDGQDPPNRSV